MLLPNEVYTSGRCEGNRKQKLVYLAAKNSTYRSWSDVERLMQRVLAEVNQAQHPFGAELYPYKGIVNEKNY